MKLEIIREGDPKLGQGKHIKHEHEEMNSCEEGSATEQLRVFGDVVVVKDG